MSEVMVSDGSKAARAFAEGLPVEAGDLLRRGVCELILENERLREILRALSRQGLGDAAKVEVYETTDGTTHIVVCCASRGEVELTEAIVCALGQVFEPERGELTGVTAAEAAGP